jgi:hypothetical protein
LSVEAGTTSESFNPTTMAGILRQRLIKGPATPVSKSAFFEGVTLSILMIAPKVPKGENGKGRK